MINHLRIVCVSILLGSVLAGSATAGVNQWTPRPLEGTGEIRRVVVASQDADLVYAASPHAGIFRSDTAGQRWRQVNHGLTELNVAALTISPDDPRILYAGTISGRIFKTVDGGEEWMEVRGALNGAVDELVALPNGVVLAMFSSSVIWRSSDAGATWQPRNSGCRSNSPLKRSPSGLVACGAYPVAVSDDGGMTWRDLNAVKSTSAIAFGADGAAYVTGSEGIFQSTDGARTWQKFADKPPIHLLIRDLLVSRDGTLFLSTNQQGLWERRNGIWLQASMPPTVSVTRFASGAPWSERIYLASNQGVFTTPEGESSWTQVSAGMTNAVVHDVAVAPADPEAIFAIAGNKAYRSEEAGDWKELGEVTQSWITASAESPNVVYTSKRRVQKSSDGGDTWTEIGPESATALEVASSDPSTLYAAFINRGMERSIDGGSSWTPIMNNMFIGYYSAWYGFYADVEIAPSDAATAYVHQESLLYRTNDGGARWSPTARGGWSPAVDAKKPSTLYALFPEGVVPPIYPASGLARSDDGGEQWIPLRPPTDDSVTDVLAHPSRSGVLFANTLHEVFLSEDFGSTWTRLGEPFVWPIRSLATDATGRFLVVGAPGGIYEYEISDVDVFPPTAGGEDAASLIERMIGLGASSRAGFILPVVGRLRGGSGLYRTDITIANERDAEQRILVAWLPRDGDGGMITSTVSVPPRSAADDGAFAIPNIAGRLGVEGAGTLVAVAVDASGEIDGNASIDGSARICAHSRQRNPVCETIEAVRADRFAPRTTASAAGLRADSQSRANVGIANLGNAAARFTVTAEGERLREVFEIVVPPFSLVQRPLPAGDYGALTLRVETDGSRPWLLYGSSVENQTGISKTVVGAP